MYLKQKEIMNGKILTPYIAMGFCMDVTKENMKAIEGKSFDEIADVRKETHKAVRVLSIGEFVIMLNTANENLNHYWFANVNIRYREGEIK